MRVQRIESSRLRSLVQNVSLLALICASSHCLAAEAKSSILPDILVQVPMERPFVPTQSSATGLAADGSAASGYRVEDANLGPLGDKKILDTPYSIASIPLDLMVVAAGRQHSGRHQIRPFGADRAARQYGFRPAADARLRKRQHPEHPHRRHELLYDHGLSDGGVPDPGNPQRRRRGALWRLLAGRRLQFHQQAADGRAVQWLDPRLRRSTRCSPNTPNSPAGPAMAAPSAIASTRCTRMAKAMSPAPISSGNC